jgi:PIN domain nuclease of toxin-antitoxin system
MVIDSHTLLWWFEGGEKLSAPVREILSGIGGKEREFMVSAVTFWELRLKELRGQLQLKRPLREWPGVLIRTGNVRLMDVTTEIWFLTAEIQWAHRDPADRIIAATALKYGVSVLTKDDRFHKDGSPVKAVW